jgi:hypothetical protein
MAKASNLNREIKSEAMKTKVFVEEKLAFLDAII